ncbi:major capsid protein [Gordonia sp. LUNF6]|uniref:major capsid protein n=1 Tax=unclassified Gordonia (in: high G+C Gram-positive bacteria) TaxID=2657482 RepID=UPI000AF92CD5|nr:major capsid protein [Gordonia sp. QH-12]
MATLNLQAILDQTAGKTAEDVAGIVKAAASAEGVDRDQITAVMDEAVEKFQALNDQDDLKGDDLAAFELIGEVITATRAVQTELAEADAAAKAKRDELAAKVLGTDETAETPAEAEDPSDDDAQTDNTAADTADEAATPEAAPEPVTASAKPLPRINLATIKGKAPEPKPVETPSGLAITAAAGVRGVENGANLDMDGLVAAVQARIQGMPRGGNGYVKDGVAQIAVTFPEDLVASGDGDDTRVINHAGDQNRLDGGLVASGGWCAPSETLYDLAPMLADPNAGLIDVPETQVKRGGINFTQGVDFASVWAGNAGLMQTEAQAEANETKALYRPTCPEFTDVRADVMYSGMTVGFLQNDAYPETTKDALAGVTAVHAHRFNAETIKRMAAASTAVDLTGKIGPSATGSILNGIGLQITDYRYKYRAPESLVLDVVLPIWTKEVARADYSLREGIPLENVTDQMIAKWIADRGGRVQWVYDWQDAYTGVTGGFGSTTAITEYPTSVEALIYVSGTFVRGRGEVVNLDMVYDSAEVQKNDYLQMFMEEKLLVAKRAYSSLKVKLALGVNGTVGAAQVLDSNGKVVPATP